MMSGLRQAGYGAFSDLGAAMRAGANRGPVVMQADLDNSDISTAQTIAGYGKLPGMCSLIKESINDPVVQAVARRAWETWGQGSSDPRSVAWSAWWYAKHSIKFVRDQSLARRFVGFPAALEFLVSPAVMLRTRKMQGDCDDFTMMICALLGVFGIGYEIITVAATPREPGVYSHVYCRAILPDGTRVPLDASHGKYPGWQVPPTHVTRLQAWDADGNQVADAGSSNWDGLHGYVARRGLGACGDCLTYDEAGNCMSYDDASCSDSSSGYQVIGPPALAPSTPVAGAGNTCIATNAADCPAGTTFVQGSTLPGFSATPTLSTVGAALTPFETALASLLGTGSQAASSVLKSVSTPAGTVNVNTNQLLLYAGLAVAAVVVLSLVGKK